MKFGYLLLAATATALTIDTRHFKGKALSHTNTTVKALGRHAGGPTVVTERDVDTEAVAKELSELVARYPKHRRENSNQSNAGHKNNTVRLADKDTKGDARQVEIEKLTTRVHELEELVARRHKIKAMTEEDAGIGHEEGKAKRHNQSAGGTPGNNTARAVDGGAVAGEVGRFARAKRHV